MLQIIRDRAQSWIAWVIVILIIIPFALWGINQYFDGGKEISAAKVNDVEITQQALQQAVYQQQERLREMLGANYRSDMFPEDQLRQQVLEGMIERELLLQMAAGSGMRIADMILAATIRSIPAFQENGEFSQEAYERAVRMRGMNPAVFEAELRRDLISQQFYTGLARTDFATPAERQQQQQLELQRRDIGYLVVPVASFEGKVGVSDAEVQAFYDEQSRLFMQPEQVKVNYLELAANNFAKDIKVGEDELRARYQGQLANYQEAEQRRARHILITVSADADEAAVEAARTKAIELLSKLRGGASFADMAKKHSQDPGSAAQGGDLGFFGRGIMDPVFEDAVFALKQGELSEPVRSSFGFHLIRLEEVSGGKTKAFEEVREQLLAELRTERAEQQFYAQAEQLANLTYEHPDTLEEAARQLGLSVQSSELFSRRGGKDLWANPKLVAAAFNEDVLARGNNSEPIEVDKNHLVVLRVAEHQPEVRRPLSQVKADILTRLRRDKAGAEARTLAADLLQQLQQGAEPQAVAKKANVKWVRSDDLGRDNQSLDAAIMRAAFAMPRPKESGASWQQTTLASGDQAVIALYGVHTIASAEGEAGAGGAELESANGDAAFVAALKSMRARAAVSKPQSER